MFPVMTTEGGQCLAFSDACLTQTGPVQVPIPGDPRALPIESCFAFQIGAVELRLSFLEKKIRSRLCAFGVSEFPVAHRPDRK